MFVVYRSNREFFTHMEIYLTYARHSWPLSSKGSLACHTYCDTGASVYHGHLRGPVSLTPIEGV